MDLSGRETNFDVLPALHSLVQRSLSVYTAKMLRTALNLVALWGVMNEPIVSHPITVAMGTLKGIEPSTSKHNWSPYESDGDENTVR